MNSQAVNLSRLSVWERIAGVVVLLLVTVYRWREISRFRVESDEPQHLHVVWGWTRGLLQYRDFFDNHTPLFHLLYAPVLTLLGERADVVVAMRIALLPLFALTLFCIWILGRALHNARTGWWAMLLTAAEATFFYTSLEFRADVLWALLWMATLAVLLTSAGRWSRVLLAGFLLGATLAASIKTALLVVSFCIAAAIWLVLQRIAGGRLDWRKMAGQFTGFVAASFILPVALAAYFYLRGGWPELVYCLFHHNTGTAAKLLKFQADMLFLPAFLGVAIAGCWLLLRRKSDVPFGSALLLLGTAIYPGLLLGYWVLLTPLTGQDWLPFVPMLMIVVASLLSRMKTGWRVPVTALVMCGLLIHLSREPKDGNTTPPGKYERFIANILRLTGPDDYVMDAKGEAIYRRRPYYFCLETQTRRQIISGDLPDNIPERLIATRTAVARTNRLPDRADAFVEKNYVRVGRGTCVLGMDLFPDSNDPARFTFEVAVPQRYVIVGDNGPVTGTLDGAPLTGPVQLSAGMHTFIRSSPDQPMALFWARAAELGYSPFTERNRGGDTP